MKLIVLILLLFPSFACALTTDKDESPNSIANPTPTNLCTFTTTLENARLYAAPLTHDSQQKDTLQPNTPYPAILQNGEHYLIQFSETDTGWVDRRAGFLTEDCAVLPTDPTPLQEFDSICLFTASIDSPMFGQADLTNPRGSLPANESKVVIGKTDSAYLLFLDHAFAAWVSLSNGQLSGTCDSLPITQ